MTTSANGCLRVLLAGVMGVLVSHLKGESMRTPHYEKNACEEAWAVGAECSVCETRFRFCQGHFVYEPVTVLLFEALATVVLSACITCQVLGFRAGCKVLCDWEIARTVAPVGLIYIIGDAAELMAVRLSSPMTVAVISQSRMMLVAVLRFLFLGKQQTLAQSAALVGLVCLSSLSLAIDSSHSNRGVLLPSSGPELMAVALVLVKTVIACGGAVYSEYYLKHEKTQALPLSVTQCHFKLASSVSAVAVMLAQGSVDRIFAQSWAPELHGNLLPPGVLPGHPRRPFFGGWDAVTCLLAASLVVNNFLIGDLLRRLSSISKYAAGACTFALTYGLAVVLGTRPGSTAQTLCCASMALLVMIYAALPSPSAKSAATSASASATKED